jgi:hypothetical protein
MGQCTFCEREALTPSYIQPPLCEKHHTITVIASLLKSHGHPASAENIKRFVELHPKTGIRPDEVEGLYEAVSDQL